MAQRREAQKSLPVDPSILWRKQIDTLSPVTVWRLTAYGSGFAWTSLQKVHFFDWQGTEIGSVAGSSADFLRGPASDAEGSLYFSGRGLYGLAPSGAAKWFKLPTVTSMSAPALGDNGRVYAVGVDARLYALTSDDGSTAFAATGVGASSSLTWLVGIGETVFAPSPDEQTLAFDRAGRFLGGLRLADGAPLTVVLAAPELGLVSIQRQGGGSRLVVLNKCGEEKWRMGGAPNILPRLVAYDDELVVQTYSPGATRRPTSIVSATGEVRSGPSDIGEPYLVGADNILISVRCLSGEPAELVASDRTLVPRWTLPLDAWCPTAATISPDGVLVLAGEDAGRNQLMGIQTTSPGAGQTAWSTVHGNVGASHWAAAN